MHSKKTFLLPKDMFDWAIRNVFDEFELVEALFFQYLKWNFSSSST